MPPPLQLASQDGRIKLWHILHKELVHPKFWQRRLLGLHDSCVIEEKSESLLKIGNIKITPGYPLLQCLILRQRLFQPCLQEHR